MKVLRRYLLRNVFSRSELLADGSQGRLVHITDTVVEDFNGLVTLPLSRSLISAKEMVTKVS